MARPQKLRCICSVPEIKEFVAKGGTGETINLTYDEYEVIRLLDDRRLNQEECAARMNVSRSTVTRIYDEARRKIAAALVNGYSLTISGGDVTVCTAMRPECAGEVNCCHRKREQAAGR